MKPKSKLTFAAWLRRQRRRDDPVGDLARDVVTEGRIYTIDRLERRLDDACEGARLAFRRAVQEYTGQNY